MLLGRALGAEHGEAELQREQLAAGEPHRPEEMVGHDGDLVGLDVDLQSFDEPAGHFEPLRDRLQVLQDHIAIDPGLVDELADGCASPSAKSGMRWRMRRNWSAAAVIGGEAVGR